MGKDPTLMSKEEFFARIEEAEREIAEGKGNMMKCLDQGLQSPLQCKGFCVTSLNWSPRPRHL